MFIRKGKCTMRKSPVTFMLFVSLLLLHLMHEGCQIWAEAMEPKLAEQLGEKKAEHQTKLIIDTDALKPIEPIAGSLVIVGGGKVPDVIWQRFMKLAGGKNAHIVVIPTASKEADTLDLDEYLKTWRGLNPASLTILHTRSKEDANDPNFVKPLEKATAIWFGGGRQSRIADAYLGTLAEKKFHEVLKRDGVIGGTSAGAAIMSRTMIARGHPKPEIETGLGFIPGAIIDQHFIKRQRQVRLVDAVTSYPYLVGLGIDEGTALVVYDGSKIDVLGDSCVTIVFSPHGNYPIKIEKIYPKKQTDNKPYYIADLIKLTRLAQDRCQPTD
jgi:cyanophycinase